MTQIQENTRDSGAFGLAKSNKYYLNYINYIYILGEIIATQRRATPTQRHAKHGSTLKEKLAFLSGTMDFHKPNGSEQIQFFPNIPENIFGNDQREFHQYRMKKNYFRSRRCV